MIGDSAARFKQACVSFGPPKFRQPEIHWTDRRAPSKNPPPSRRPCPQQFRVWHDDRSAAWSGIKSGSEKAPARRGVIFCNSKKLLQCGDISLKVAKNGPT